MFPNPHIQEVYCYIIEPVGTRTPTVPVNERIGGSTHAAQNIVALLCPAQGFPVPGFRYLYTPFNKYYKVI